MNDTLLHSKLQGLRTKALAVGVIGLGVSVIGAFSNADQFFVSYLVGYLFWLGVSLGCLGFLMIHHLTGGRWGFPVRRFYEAAAMTLPLMAVLFVPVCFGLHHLYQWTNPAAVAADPAMLHRAGYMNTTAFVVRAAVFFILWIIISFLLNRWSFEQDSAEATSLKKMRTLSGPGIVLYPLTATFVFVDWVLSLEPDWFSTMFLVLIVIGQMLTGLTFSIMLLAWVRRDTPYASEVTSTHFYHLGMLLLAFVMLWTYMAFAEFLIIYSGNQPHEIAWYLHRIAGSWKLVVWFLFLFHFLLPFFVLLSRDVKRNVPALTVVAATVFLAHFVDTYWLIVPTFHPTGIHFHWLDITAPLGIGGVWLAAFVSRLNNHPFLVRIPQPAHEK